MHTYSSLFASHIFHFCSKDNILEEKDLGVCADIASILTPERSVAALDCFQGCPYTNTGFRFDVRIDGECIPCQSWEWLPNAMLRHGRTETFCVDTLTAVAAKSRSVVMQIRVTNLTDTVLTVPLQVPYRGRTRLEQNWQFPIPASSPCTRDDFSAHGRILSSCTDETAFHITASLENMRLFSRAYLWEGEITLPVGEAVTLYFSAHMGKADASLREAQYALDHYDDLLASSFGWLARETQRIHDHLPRLHSNEPALDRLYYRSLVTYLLSRWDNPDLCAMPYFSTGSINGGCMCSYLWDYCGGLMLHPIYDSEGNKAQLRAYLRNDLSTSYALNPVTSSPVGPWYQVNQEKIICMVYYHVLFTGEKEFLFEQVGSKTVLEWMKHHAYVCDDLAQDVALYDYGVGGDDHLEIASRGNGPYNGVMPDLNARRYMNYMRVYELTVLAGQPDERLPQRASALRRRLRTLWNEKENWYDFIDANGNRSIRYTVQMFKFLSSPVIGETERRGLISHLNETEFLSKFGLHSMSKLDPQYDQDDIDNGGGGICTHFTMQICAQLYDTGYDALATDILRRVYWWGERMPYMGDSCAANMIANREDTPLQGDISSTACAQMIFYFIFGIRADFDGNICISPVKNRPAQVICIENARLCGKVFSVQIDGDAFTVTTHGESRTAAIGETITL